MTRVLHVDDEPDIREVVEVSLGLDPDFAVQSCASGDAAIGMAADWRPDMILLDVMMPTMDGPTTLTHLRANPRTSDIPVVFMTARAQTQEVERFRSLGAEGVIAKPFDPMTLAASVRSYLPKSEVSEARYAFVHRQLRKTFLQRAKMDAAVLIPYSSASDEQLNSAPVLRRIKDIAHGLATSANALGFDCVGRDAKSLENAVRDCGNGNGAFEYLRKAVAALLGQIEIVLAP